MFTLGIHNLLTISPTEYNRGNPHSKGAGSREAATPLAERSDAKIISSSYSHQ